MSAITGADNTKVFAAIDVGTNAVRLKIARLLPDGSLETLYQDRDPVRPGEGLFLSGSMPRATGDRLLGTLRRYGALTRRYHATTRAVATSAVREARNRELIVRRAREEAEIELEVVSGQEEARLICLGVLHDRPPGAKSVLVDTGGGSTEVVFARGDHPRHLWSIAVGSVRLTQLLSLEDVVPRKKLKLVRSLVEEAFAELIPSPDTKVAFGSSGTAQTVISYASPRPENKRATRDEITRAVEELAAMDLNERRKLFPSQRAEIVVAGAVILEAVLKRLEIGTIQAVDQGLREGVLVDLIRRRSPEDGDTTVFDAALEFGDRLRIDMGHAKQVARLSLSLFDQLTALHQLPRSNRSLLEIAALLHDVGHSVNHARHHKHAYYLIKNADLPGLNEHEQELIALIARFHRRSPPEPDHPDIQRLSKGDRELVRRLVTFLRLADSLDRGHHQNVTTVRAHNTMGNVKLHLTGRSALDLELWDTEQEAGLFQSVFHKKLELSARVRHAA